MALAPYDWRRDFAEKLERAMIVRGLNAPALARKIHVDKATIGRWLSGRSLPQKPELLTILDTALGLSGFLTLPAEPFFERNGLFEHYRGMTYLKIIRNNADAPGKFEKSLESCLAATSKSLHYTRLCDFDAQADIELSDDDFNYTPHELRIDWFLDKFIETEIIWQKVEVFFSLRQLVQALRVIRLLEGTAYITRFYRKPPRSFPVINVESFDHKQFLLGGYDPERVFRPNCILMGDREPMRDFLVEYWNAVWAVGRPERLTVRNSYQVAKDLSEISEDDWNYITQRVMDETAPLAR